MVIYKGKEEIDGTDMEKNYNCLNLPHFVDLIHFMQLFPDKKKFITLKTVLQEVLKGLKKKKSKYE